MPFFEVDGVFMGLREISPAQLKALAVGRKDPRLKITDRLLVQRMRVRRAQGRVMTIYRINYPPLTPEEQIKHMETRTPVGLNLIEAERRLLEWELTIIGGA